MTVNVELLAPTPLTVTSNVPDVAPDGTMAVMLVDDHAVTAALVEFNETVLLPCVPPKPVPVIVTGIPTGPELGEIAVIVGDWPFARPQHRKRNEAMIRKKRFRLHRRAIKHPDFPQLRPSKAFISKTDSAAITRSHYG